MPQRAANGARSQLVQRVVDARRTQPALQPADAAALAGVLRGAGLTQVLFEQVAHLLLDAVRIFTGLHPPDRLVHVRADGHPRSIEELAHQSRHLSRVVLVESLDLARHLGHRTLHPLVVDVRRRIVAGELINSFLVDPNGFNNEGAQDELAATRRSPWEGFLLLNFGRRVD